MTYVRARGGKAIRRGEFDIDDLYERFIYPTYEVDLIEDRDLGTDPSANRILGQYDVEANAIYLAPELQGDPRRTFTFLHELGHALIHGPRLREQANQDLLLVTDVAGRMEAEANLFAAHAAAPDDLIATILEQVYQPTGPFPYFGPEPYDLTAHGVRKTVRVDSLHQLCVEIARNMHAYFGGLSREALAYRLEESPFVKDFSKTPNTLQRSERRRGPQRRPRAWSGGHELVRRSLSPERPQPAHP